MSPELAAFCVLSASHRCRGTQARRPRTSTRIAVQYVPFEIIPGNGSHCRSVLVRVCFVFLGTGHCSSLFCLCPTSDRAPIFPLCAYLCLSVLGRATVLPSLFVSHIPFGRATVLPSLFVFHIPFGRATVLPSVCVLVLTNAGAARSVRCQSGLPMVGQRGSGSLTRLTIYGSLGGTVSSE